MTSANDGRTSAASAQHRSMSTAQERGILCARAASDTADGRMPLSATANAAWMGVMSANGISHVKNSHSVTPYE